jgi:hypothetical protein
MPPDSVAVETAYPQDDDDITEEDCIRAAEQAKAVLDWAGDIITPSRPPAIPTPAIRQ